MNCYDVCVIGLGYIGVPTATIFATKGKNVLGVDVSEERVNNINAGKSHVGEQDIDDLLAKVVRNKTLKASLIPESSEYYIIAVPTPFKTESKNVKLADMRFVEAATRSIAPCLENNQVVILESTSPVGTTAKMKDWLADELKKIGRFNDIDYASIQFVHCPERILPGQMLKELVKNDRICGGMTPDAAIRARDLYKVFCEGEILLTDDKTAEMSKLTENAFRDVEIAFANELSIVCDKLGINVWELIKLANRHPRVNILQPGPGVGGHCIAVDPWFIIEVADKETPLMRTARNVNDGKPHHVIEKVKTACSNLKNPTVACLGLTFKANVNDLRESPALNIVRDLSNEGFCNIIAVEPHITELPVPLKGKVNLKKLDEATNESDVILLLVDHKEFATLKLDSLKEKIIIDTKGFIK